MRYTVIVRKPPRRFSPLMITFVLHILVGCFVLTHASFYNKYINTKELCDRISVNKKTENVSADFWCLHGHYWKNGMNYTLLPTNDTNDLKNQKIILTKCESLPTKWRTPIPLCRESCDGREVLVEGQRFLNVTFSQKESSAYPGRYTNGATAFFSCTGEYMLLQGVTSISCNDSGSWGTFTFPKCVPSCEPFSVQDKGIGVEYHSQQAPTSNGRYVDQSVAVFRCLASFHDLKGSTSLVCMTHQNSGEAQWNGIEPECEATCAGIRFNRSSLMVNYEPLAINGRFEPSLNGRFSVNTAAKFSCDRHQIVYHLVGESTSICQKNGEWKTLDQSPQCVPTCGIDELIGAYYESFLKVEISGENYTDNIGTGNIRYEAGALGTFICSDKNMQLIGEAQTTCLSNGSWTDPGHQKCEQTCPQFSSSSKMDFTYNKKSFTNKSLPAGRYPSGTKVTIKCKKVTNQPKEMLCTQEGIWEGYKDDITCVTTCGDPFLDGVISGSNDEGSIFINSSFSHLVLEEPSDRYPIDTVVTHECIRNGLKMNGSHTQKCLSSGKWDGTFPSCIDDGIEESASPLSRVNVLVPVFIVITLIATLFIIVVIMDYLRKRKGETGLIELFRDGCSRFTSRKQSQPIPTSDPY